MDFFHDALALPGSSASHAHGRPSKAPCSPPSARLTPSLLRALRDPYNLIGAKAGEAEAQRTHGGDGPQLADQEWRKQVLILKISQAKCYTDWLSAASELDHLEGRDEWKADDECTEYDTDLVRARLQELEEARINCDANRVLFLARTSLTRDLGGMGDLGLYKHCRVGTKTLIERYIEAALDTLDALVDLSSPKKDSGLRVRDVYEQLLSARQAFGRSALLLSGGGTLGMNHIGVIKSLFEAQLLPRIISGASAGSIVAAVLCTKTDDEIPQVLRDFCHGDLDVFERQGEEEGVLKKAFRFLTKGALFDISNLIRVMKDLLGDMTFQEAYNRTRRILNICVSTASLYELPRLLNYVTAPNVMIWSAVATSCSVPFVFSPAQLLAKDPRTGLEVPWDQSPQRWIDGSVDNDLPMTRLSEMFNVNHFIVSQVNPHVVPFLERDEEAITLEAQASRFGFAAGPSWLRSFADLAKGEALHRMHVLSELGFLPTTMSKIRSVLSQRYSGDITILPEVQYTQFPRVLKNPTSDFMTQAMLSGERATWPKLGQVRNHCAIELALDHAVQKVRYGLVFSPSQVDLRLNTFANTAALDLAGPGKRRKTRRASHGNLNQIDRVPLLVVPQSLGKTETNLPVLRIPGPDPDLTSSGQETAISSTTEVNDSDDEWSDSSMESPPSPRPTLWPSTRPLFPSLSTPTTPNISSKLYRSSLALPLTMTESQFNNAPVNSEFGLKPIFQNARPADVTGSRLDGFGFNRHTEDDMSGTKGIVRRKRSLTTGFKGLWPPGKN